MKFLSKLCLGFGLGLGLMTHALAAGDNYPMQQLLTQHTHSITALTEEFTVPKLKEMNRERAAFVDKSVDMTDFDGGRTVSYNAIRDAVLNGIDSELSPAQYMNFPHHVQFYKEALLYFHLFPNTITVDEVVLKKKLQCMLTLFNQMGPVQKYVGADELQNMSYMQALVTNSTDSKNTFISSEIVRSLITKYTLAIDERSIYKLMGNFFHEEPIGASVSLSFAAGIYGLNKLLANKEAAMVVGGVGSIFIYAYNFPVPGFEDIYNTAHNVGNHAVRYNID